MEKPNIPTVDKAPADPSKRRFLSRLGKGLLLVGLSSLLSPPDGSPRPARAAQDEELVGLGGPDTPYTRIAATAKDIPNLDPNISAKLVKLEQSEASYTGRWDEIAELARNNPELDLQYRLMLQQLRTSPWEAMPFPSIKRSAERTTSLVENRFNTAAAKASQPNIDWIRENQRLAAEVDSATANFTQRFGESARTGCRNQGVTIVLDPSIVPTEEGYQLFEEDQRTYSGWLEDTPLRDLCTRHVLSSKSRYGQRGGENRLENDVGDYIFEKQEGTNLIFEAFTVNMDPTKALGEFAPKVGVNHEVVGHGGSVFYENTFNVALVNLLEPEQVIERMIAEMKVLNRPESGANFTSVQEMFTGHDQYPADLPDYLKNAVWVDDNVIKAVTRRYPINALIEPFKIIPRNPDGKLGNAKLVSMIDIIAVESKSPESKFKIIPPLDDPNKTYSTFSSFAEDYLPVLREEAQAGNVRAKVLEAGLTAFGEYFDNYEFLVDGTSDKSIRLTPKTDKTGSTWVNFVNTYVANAIMIHLFMNGEINGIDYRELFTDSERDTAEKSTLIRLLRARNEYWAENVGYALAFKDRINPNPYSDSLRDLGHLLR